MQRKLSQWATDDPEKKFTDLYSLLCNEVWLRVAAHETLKNHGSNTAGIDGQTKSNFLGDFDGHINRLQERLKAKVLEPMPVRRVYIPKPNSEKKRPLGIPTLLDRIVQEALRMILEPIWEADFSRHSYGFRPNRSTYDAITYIWCHLTGHGSSYQWIIEGDIASYFDTIPHRRLMKAELKNVLDHMGLKLSEEKTRVTHITEGFQFLGYRIIRGIGGRGTMTPKVLIPESAIKRFQYAVRRILAPNTTKESTVAKMYAINQLTRGWCEYYRSTSSPSVVFRKLDYEVFEGMKHWLGKKYKIGAGEVILRYQIAMGLPKGLGTRRITLISPAEYKAKRLLAKTWHNPYTAKEAIIREKFLWYESLWSGYDNRIEGGMDQREEVIRLKGTVCALNYPDICKSKGKPLHPS